MKLKNLNNVNVGIDLVEINRFKKISFNENKSFYRKNFSKDEIEYCLKFSEPYKHFAGKFAIKESVIKAIPEKISFLDICTSHSKNKPKILLNNELNRKYRFLVSVSHEKDYAISFVIAFKNEKKYAKSSK